MSVYKHELNNKAKKVLSDCDEYLDFMGKYNKTPDHLVLTSKDVKTLSDAISAVAKNKKLNFNIDNFVYRNCNFKRQ